LGRDDLQQLPLLGGVCQSADKERDTDQGRDYRGNYLNKAQASQ